MGLQDKQSTESSLENVVEESGLRWYVIDGKHLPSVTSVLGWCFKHPDWLGYDMNDPAVIYARNRGRAVHKGCYWLALGRRLNPKTVDDALVPYIDQFRNFLTTTGFRTEEAEFLVCSKHNGYAGRGDLKGHFPTSEARHLLDIKTGIVEPWLAGYQTAAYLRGDREKNKDMCCTKRSVLKLDGDKPDGWKLVSLADPEDLVYFMNALNVFKAAKRNGAL